MKTKEDVLFAKQLSGGALVIAAILFCIWLGFQYGAAAFVMSLLVLVLALFILMRVSISEAEKRFTQPPKDAE